LRAVEHVDAVLPPVRIVDSTDHVQIDRDTAGPGVMPEHGGIAHQDRMAGCAHGRIERRLEADLRPDPRGIAGGDSDFRFYSHGINEAWITSGTPSPPTERMARSTSFSPNRWVVTSSSGKRLDASCSSASSQAR